MKQFGSMAAFAAEITALEAGVVFELEKGMEAVASKIEKTAKDEIGEYQEAVGPFTAWEELADSTKSDRVRHGYTENNPGLRNGDMRDSIKNQTNGLEAVIGSNDDKLLWFEFGTVDLQKNIRQPPRPVLGMAIEKTDIGKIVSENIVNLFRGHRR